jgi:hypothetical protein
MPRTIRRCLALLAGLAVALAAAQPADPGAAQKQPLDPGDNGKADDAVRRLLLAGPKPAKDIFEIRQRLLKAGKLQEHLVVNGGHDNPERAPGFAPHFMCFATFSSDQPAVAADELFLGFFLETVGNTLVVSPGFVELIAWDRTREVYNFWELINGRWLYRGDSTDVLGNVSRVNTGAVDTSFQFTRKPYTNEKRVLRCSGCHTLGAPIMKELEPPINDWQTKDRKLNLGGIKLRPGDDPADPAHVAARLFRDAAPAENLAAAVKAGTRRLLEARAKRGGDGQTLKQQLRSLFTTMEMNLVSDRKPLRVRIDSKEAVELPAAFFVDPRLTGPQPPVAVKIDVYLAALKQVKSTFAAKEKAGLVESHHAFLVPARSDIDNVVLDTLVRKGLLNDEMIAAVLAVDFTTPVFSPARASLLRYVPEKAMDVADLEIKLIANLRKAPPGDAAARALLAHLTNLGNNAQTHRQAALKYLHACRRVADQPETVAGWLRLAAQRRLEIEAADTARHPEGRIIEHGFRQTFPEIADPPRPGALRLDRNTGETKKGGGL